MSLSRLSVTSIVALILFAIVASPAAAQQRQDFGTLSIQVRPPDAAIFIDGERWTGPEVAGPLQVQLSPGPHRVEVRSPGHRPYAAQISIRAGETTPLNVALPLGSPETSRPEAPAGPPPPASGNITQVSDTADGFVFAPDFKVTEIAHETSGLAGAYGGYVFAGQFLIGGGAYVQTNTTNGARLFYGGPVVEWRMFPESTIGLTLHGLVGGGQFYHDGGYYYVGRDVDPRMMHNDPRDGYPYGFHDETFFVAEPEAQVVIRFGTSARLQLGGGYRATSAHGLSGASGSISLQFGR